METTHLAELSNIHDQLKCLLWYLTTKFPVQSPNFDQILNFGNS